MFGTRLPGVRKILAVRRIVMRFEVGQCSTCKVFLIGIPQVLLEVASGALVWLAVTGHTDLNWSEAEGKQAKAVAAPKALSLSAILRCRDLERLQRANIRTFNRLILGSVVHTCARPGARVVRPTRRVKGRKSEPSWAALLRSIFGNSVAMKRDWVRFRTPFLAIAFLHIQCETSAATKAVKPLGPLT